MDSGLGGPGSNPGAAIGNSSQLVIKTPKLGVSPNGSPIVGFTPTITWVSPNLTLAEPSAFSITLGSMKISLLSSKALPSALLPSFISLVILFLVISGTISIFSQPIQNYTFSLKLHVGVR